jgi:ABC-type sugar transport system substrate-binding protein
VNLRTVGAVLGLAATLAGCASPEPTVPEVSWLLGVSQANTTEPWRLSVIADIQKEAAGFPGLRVVVSDASDSVVKQGQDLDRLLGLGCDLLVVSPADAERLRPAIDRAYRKVPVIVIDRAVEGYNYSLYVGPDNRRIGREAGKYVAGLLGPRGGQVLEVLGRKDSPPSVDRSLGFREALADRPDIVISRQLEAEWLQDRAEDVLLPYFRSGGRPDVVFAQNDAMAAGTWLAARQAGVTGLPILGIDGLPGPDGGLSQVRQGRFVATFNVPTGGREAVDYAVDILRKVPGIPKKIILRTSIVTREAPDLPEAVPPPRVGPGTRPLLGFSQVGSESIWRRANSQSILTAAQAAGIDLMFDPGDQTQARQIEAIRGFIRQRVNVIAFSPIVETGWDEVLNEARRAGIPVILSDRRLGTSDPNLSLTYVGSDFEEEGRRAASWLLGRFPTGPVRGIVEIRGTEGSSPALDRSRGFRQILGQGDRLNLVASLAADFTRAGGQAAMTAYLKAPHRPFSILFAHNDDMALGAIEALKAAGLKPGADVVVVSVDAIREAFESMVKGELSCTVECTPLLGPQLMKIVGDFMKGKTLPWQYISSEEVFPAEVAARQLPLRQY